MNEIIPVNKLINNDESQSHSLNNNSKCTRERSRENDKKTKIVKRISKNTEEEIIFINEKDESNINTKQSNDYQKLQRKKRIKEIQEKFKLNNQKNSTSSPNTSINIAKNSEQIKENQESHNNEMLIKYVSNQRELLEDEEKNSNNSTPDMFGDYTNNKKNIDDLNKENINNNLDLGLTSRNESIGYYKPKLDEIILNKYKVVGLCGRGIFGSVLKVLDLEYNKLYALKIIRNINIMKISGVKEKDVILSLNNQDKDKTSHVIQLINTFEFNNHICMILPLYKMNLRELIKINNKKGVPLDHVQIIAKQLFNAFILIHKNRYIHADFKPDNTLIDESLKQAYICDFGSVITDDESIVTSELVSRYYRAPEIILGFKPTNKIDIWSLGCTLFELYTGQILFPGKNNNEMMKLFLEYNGRFLNKLIKNGEYIGLYFTEDFNHFKSLEKDNKTNQTLIKLIDVNNIKNKDLSNVLFDCCKRKNDSKDKIKKFINLLEYCLNIDPYKRISAIDAYTHPFFWN